MVVPSNNNLGMLKKIDNAIINSFEYYLGNNKTLPKQKLCALLREGLNY